MEPFSSLLCTTITDTTHNLFFALWILCYLNPLVSSKTFACGLKKFTIKRFPCLSFWLLLMTMVLMGGCVWVTDWLLWARVCVYVMAHCIHYVLLFIFMNVMNRKEITSIDRIQKYRPHIFNSNNYKWLVNGECVCVLHAQLESNWLDNKNRNLTFKWSSSSMSCHFICLCHSENNNCATDWQLTT